MAATVPSRVAPAAAGSLSSTRLLLGALVVSSPLWAAVSLAQVPTREGFDLTRHPLSMLATGSLAWLQIANFVLAGALAVAGAVGLARASSSRWVPRLVATYGVGYILCGVFPLDPGDGFPAGTPRGEVTSISWHAGLHLLAGTVAFAALVASLIIFGRFFARQRERWWSAGCYVAAAGVVVADIASMGGAPAPPVWLATGVIAAMLWLSVIAARLLRQEPR